VRILKNACLSVSSQCPPLRNGLLRLLKPPEQFFPDQARWDREYASGGWEWLKSEDERLHNHIIAAYCARFGRDAAILDVGCGEGVLHDMLARSGYRRYVGIDISPTAIERMASRRDSRTRFLVANAETLALPDQFDIVVINEVLYYFRDPLAVLTRLGAMISAGACIIISMADVGFRATLRHQKLWQDIETVMPMLDGISLRYAKGLNRTIRIFGLSGATAAIG
jgi:2-polyprenyl-3-methyl-5-hydroxy-6-metoxy-1,4-benzoquinol methylase